MAPHRLPLPLPLLTFSFLLLRLPAIALVEGCYWMDSCSNRWFGGCGVGKITIGVSDDCLGLCPQPQYSSCLPFSTHFQCCEEETPKASGTCLSCKNKVDVGEEWVCCSDCSEAVLTNKKTNAGYCMSGAQLSIQSKPRELFQWVTGPWTDCSAECDGGLMQRDVGCYGSMEYAPRQKYAVDESKCSSMNKPSHHEDCNMQSCLASLSDGFSQKTKSRGLPVWSIMLITLVSLVAVGGLAFGGYLLLQRRKTQDHGFVYVMLEGYS